MIGLVRILLVLLRVREITRRISPPLEWTRVRMGDGIAFKVALSYREFCDVWEDAFRGRQFILLRRLNGRRIYLNAKQITYCEPLDGR